MESSSVVLETFDGPFGTPATDESISNAERLLGHALPSVLKQHYRAYDGFCGPTDTHFLYSLDKLVETTLWLRNEGYFPEFIKRAVALGDYGVGPYWLILIDNPDTIVEWDACMEGEEHLVLETSLTETWLARKIWYDDDVGT
jgi:SMI1 / KNR4 family (SUKH-1)